MKPRKLLPEFTDYDLRLLRVFSAVVRGNGFAGAEVLLNKSKSAISIDISSLETRLGVTLCRRGRAGFALTAHGKEIYALTLELFKQLRDFRQRVDLVAAVVSGQLSVAMDPNLPVEHAPALGSALRRFHAAHPQVTLKVEAAPPEQVAQRVLDGSAQLGISVMPRDQPEFEAFPLFDEAVTLYCGSGHPLFDLAVDQITVEAIKAHECILLPSRQNAAGRQLMEQLRVSAQANTLETQLLLISTGQYIGLLPQSYAAPAVAAKMLRPLLAESLTFSDSVVAFILRDVPRNLACEQFQEYLCQVFKSPTTGKG